MRIFTKRLAGVVGTGVATGLVLTAVAHAAVTFGPSRPTFTMAHPADHITFNSITDNSTWGDERYLVKARDVNAGTNTYSTNMAVTDNEELLVTVYFHNDADSSLNLTATGTKAKIALPSGAATTQEITGTISADNATPQSVFSTLDLTNSQPFTLEYEQGSAQLKTNYVVGQISDNLVNNGTSIGTNGVDGKVPGCLQFSGYALIKVRVHVQKPQVQFACTGLDVAEIDKNKGKFDFTAHGSATNATIQSYTFTAKNSNNSTVDTFQANTSATSAVYHFNQSTPGTYTVSSVVNTDHGSTSPSATCTKQVTVPTPPTTPPATPPASPPVVSAATTPLPNTGAGGTVAIFAGVSSLAGIGHFLFRRVRG